VNLFSVFSGVGGMDLGLERAGLIPVAFCESDPAAQSVLRKHWPSIPIHDDVCTVDGKVLSNVDIIAGGSPCQDLSVAGSRKGLDGERSGLFWEQCRIADQGAIPWVLWENVFGALTSNHGQDFAAVLWGLTGARSGVPDGGWRSWGVVVGPKRWAVWRVFDAQWFGVPQRRRRVFVLASSRKECRPDILLEEANCGKHLAPTEAKQAPSSKTVRAGFSSGNESDLMVYGRSSQGVYSLGVSTLAASASKRHEDNIVIPAAFDVRKSSSFSDNDVRNIRRLSILESERLMGWPHDWTAFSDTGKPIPLSVRYRLCGNGVVSSVAEWIGRRLVAACNSKPLDSEKICGLQ
jgi:DNA (cytosine-5)-methyltransferase 1